MRSKYLGILTHRSRTCGP